MLLVHGAGSGPWIFESWAPAFPDVNVAAVDLQEKTRVETACMADYADAVVDSAGSLAPPLAVCGWSMGGLVALQAAARVQPASVVLLEPSPPSEIQGRHPEIRPLSGRFDPEEVYGRFPSGTRPRPESSLARDERRRGISVPSLPCPSLVVYGSEFPDDRGRLIAALYDSEELVFPNLDHWGLVLDPRVPRCIARRWGLPADRSTTVPAP